MQVQRHLTAPFFGTLLALLAGCSGSSGKADATETEAKADGITTAAQLGTFCSDIESGHPKAARYSGNGPHRVAAFDGGYTTDADLGPGWVLQDDVKIKGVPETAKTTPVTEIELLACAKGERGTEQQRECTYVDFGAQSSPQQTYPLYNQTFTYTVYALRTGRVVTTKKAGVTNGCPGKFSSSAGGSAGPSKLYAQMSRWTTQRVLKDVVESPAR